MFMDSFLTMEKCVREVGQFSELCDAMWKEHGRGMGEVQPLAEIFFCASPFMDFQEKNGGTCSVSDLNVEVRGFLGSCSL
jgi:hypothetical protein